MRAANRRRRCSAVPHQERSTLSWTSHLSFPWEVFKGKLDKQVPPPIDGDNLPRDRGRFGQQRHSATDLFNRWADAQRRSAVHLTKLLLGLITAAKYEARRDAVDARFWPQAH